MAAEDIGTRGDIERTWAQDTRKALHRINTIKDEKDLRAFVAKHLLNEQPAYPVTLKLVCKEMETFFNTNEMNLERSDAPTLLRVIKIIEHMPADLADLALDVEPSNVKEQIQRIKRIAKDLTAPPFEAFPKEILATIATQLPRSDVRTLELFSQEGAKSVELSSAQVQKMVENMNDQDIEGFAQEMIEDNFMEAMIGEDQSDPHISAMLKKANSFLKYASNDQQAHLFKHLRGDCRACMIQALPQMQDLTRLELSGLEEVSDPIIEAIANTPHYSALTHLNLGNCPNVTVKSIETLIKSRIQPDFMNENLNDYRADENLKVEGLEHHLALNLTGSAVKGNELLEAGKKFGLKARCLLDEENIEHIRDIDISNKQLSIIWMDGGSES